VPKVVTQREPQTPGLASRPPTRHITLHAVCPSFSTSNPKSSPSERTRGARAGRGGG